MKRWKGLITLLFILGLASGGQALATDQAAVMRWFDLLSQRWLLSEELAAYQYRHALDPPVMLQPLRAPLIAYAHYIGLDTSFALSFLLAERAVDQQLQQRWLRHWQLEGFAFDTEDFLDAPALCQKQERLEREMLQQLLKLQPVFNSPPEKTRLAGLLREQVMVPLLTEHDRDHFLNALFPAA